MITVANFRLEADGMIITPKYGIEEIILHLKAWAQTRIEPCTVCGGKGWYYTNNSPNGTSMTFSSEFRTCLFCHGLGKQPNTEITMTINQLERLLK